MNKQNMVKVLPTVLFISGIVGIFVSEVMVARDTLKAEKLIHPARYVDENENYGVVSVPAEEEGCYDHIVCETRTKYLKEIITRSWKCYIPTAVTTTLTLSALIASRTLTAKQMALLSSAVASTGSLVTKYRKAILERTDLEILSEIDREVAEATMNEAHPPVIETSHMLSTGVDDLDSGDELYLFFDPFTKMKFRTTKLAVLGAKYYLNRNFSLGSEAPLSMFYGFLGLQLPEEYEYAGWDVSQMEESGYYWIDIDCVKSSNPDPETGEFYYIIEYDFLPGDTEDNYYPFGNPLDTVGSVAV